MARSSTTRFRAARVLGFFLRTRIVSSGHKHFCYGSVSRTFSAFCP